MGITSVSLDAIGKVGGAGECGGEGEGVGGEGELGTAGFGGDDILLACAEEGAGEPGGRGRGVVFGGGDDGGEVADWVGEGVPMLGVAVWKSRTNMVATIIMC